MWIEVHDTLPDHKKVLKVADILDIPDTQVLGSLICLWAWAIQNRPDGTLAANDWRVLEREARWTGEPRALFKALVTAALIDVDGDEYRFHDWMDYAGKLILAREKDRKRKSAGIPAEIQRNSSGNPKEIQRSSEGIPPATVTYTVPNPDTTATGARAHEEEVPEEPNVEEEPAGGPACKCYGHYERHIGLLNTMAIGGIKSYLDDGMEDALICAAIDECVAAGILNWKYLNTILDSCAREECWTMEAFRRRQEEFKARASPGQGSGKQKDFADRDFKNQNTYTPDEFSRMKTDVFNMAEV